MKPVTVQPVVAGTAGQPGQFHAGEAVGPAPGELVRGEERIEVAVLADAVDPGPTGEGVVTVAAGESVVVKLQSQPCQVVATPGPMRVLRRRRRRRGPPPRG